MDQQRQADAFRRMHLGPPLLVLPNAWDVASAKALATCRAAGHSRRRAPRWRGRSGWRTASARRATRWSRPRGRIAAAVECRLPPISRRGYGDPVGTARAAWDAGLVGINFEDSNRAGLFPLDEQTAAIAAIRQAVPELVVNARVDVFLRIGGDVDEAVERANAYLGAGADCTYPILCPPVSIPELARRIEGPMNVIAEQGVPGPADLQELGVARLTWGGGLAASRRRRRALGSEALR